MVKIATHHFHVNGEQLGYFLELRRLERRPMTRCLLLVLALVVFRRLRRFPVLVLVARRVVPLWGGAGA